MPTREGSNAARVADLLDALQRARNAWLRRNGASPEEVKIPARGSVEPRIAALTVLRPPRPHARHWLEQLEDADRDIGDDHP